MCRVGLSLLQSSALNAWYVKVRTLRSNTKGIRGPYDHDMVPNLGFTTPQKKPSLLQDCGYEAVSKRCESKRIEFGIQVLALIFQSTRAFNTILARNIENRLAGWVRLGYHAFIVLTRKHGNSIGGTLFYFMQLCQGGGLTQV